MSRSRKKSPVFGMTKASSDRFFKKLLHKKFRALERKILNSGEEVFPEKLEEVFDEFNSEKDGKKRINKDDISEEVFESLMRK